MLQNKVKSTVLWPDVCSYFCLVCGGWGLKMIPQLSRKHSHEQQFFEEGIFWKMGLFRKVNSPVIQALEPPEMLESPQSVKKQVQSDHLPERRKLTN